MHIMIAVLDSFDIRALIHNLLNSVRFQIV
jgi:hypothetical protein